MNKELLTYKSIFSLRHELRTTTDIIQAYENGELLINPAYKKNKWTNEQKTRFIESLLLRIPIPPIFALAISDDETDYDNDQKKIIDGMQRISAILEFTNTIKGKFKLEGASILTELNGLSWKKFKKHPELIRAFNNRTLLFGIIEVKPENSKLAIKALEGRYT